MTLSEKYLIKINQLQSLADETIASIKKEGNGSTKNWSIDSQFTTSSLSFIESLYGKEHVHYQMFSRAVNGGGWLIILQYRKGVLESIKSEIEGGWILSLKGIIAADIFSDFLDMAEHLLEQKYKDPAAVMIGSVLEEHLRQLCFKNSIPIESTKDGKQIPLKADTLNGELVKANIYNKIEQKSVTSWLGLRNSAAHGKYNEYDQKQIELMLQGVLDFMNRNKI